MNPIMIDMIARARQDEMRREYANIARINQAENQSKPKGRSGKNIWLSLAAAGAIILLAVLASVAF